ncbi:hypothetical protein B0H10DRAFT_256067 [Mycena sp. CBHHK59/15]|nr:hypothetical protein B0H10DRAFT_256067 [Mycena sp. CBHHK59/15]
MRLRASPVDPGHCPRIHGRCGDSVVLSSSPLRLPAPLSSMHRLNGSSRGAAAQSSNSAGWDRNLHPYGEGAPHGDPFHFPAPPAGPVFHDARSLGHGHPSTPRASRSTSHDTFLAATHHRTGQNHGRAASLNPLAAGNSSTSVYDPTLLSTPTPSNRYPPASQPRPAAHTQFPIPEERTQMDCLLDLMHTLRDDVREVKGRVSNIETTLANLHGPSPAVRGIAAQRGGRITQSKTAATNRRPPVIASGSDESDAPSQPTTTDFSTDTDREPDDEDGVELDAIDISKTEKRALQKLVTQTFRRLCNVPGRNWPDPSLVRTNSITDEVYPTPIFSAKVTDHRNSSFFQDVVQRVLSELQVEFHFFSILHIDRAVGSGLLA